MSKRLWEANHKIKLNSRLFNFEKFISKKYNKNFEKNFNKIFEWSINNPGSFWGSIWDFCKVKGLKNKNKIRKSKIFFKNVFLPNSKLNFAENLLSKKTTTKAITFLSENGFREERNWRDLNDNVLNLQVFLNKINIKKKDRVAAYMINSIETVEAFIATASVGAIWSSCSPDFGVNGVIERFAQIKPKILFVTDRYYYNGKKINILERIPTILKKIDSIEYLVITKYPGKNYLKKSYNFKKVKLFYWSKIKKKKKKKYLLKSLVLRMN